MMVSITAFHQPRRDLLIWLSQLSLVGCGTNEIRPDVREIAYGHHDAQRFDLYAPKRNTGRLLVLIHGGGWQQGSRRDNLWLVPQFLSQGYSVANLGYRLLAHAPAPAAAEDVREGLDKIRQITSTEHAHAPKIGIIGFSAGAHLALLAVLASSEAIRGPRFHAHAVVSFWGITDLTDLVFGPNTRDFAQRWIGQGPEAEKMAKVLSPVQYEPLNHTALLAIHSTRDPVVPFAHSQRLVSRWRISGRPAELVCLDHEGHAPDRSEYPPLLDKVNRFLGASLDHREGS
jgi:acetyl esterase/lipase